MQAITSKARMAVPAGARMISVAPPSVTFRPNLVKQGQELIQQGGTLNHDFPTYLKGNNAQAGLYGLTGLVFVGFPVLLTGLYNMVFGTNKRQPGQ